MQARLLSPTNPVTREIYEDVNSFTLDRPFDNYLPPRARIEPFVRGTQMSNQLARPQAITETVEQYLARGGVIKRIEDYPDPNDRVVLRGRRQSGWGNLGAFLSKRIDGPRL